MIKSAMRIYTPIHADTNLNDAWWSAKGLKLGEDVFYNTIRDGSGRFNGYAVVNRDSHRGHHFVKTVEEAENVLKLIPKT